MDKLKSMWKSKKGFKGSGHVLGSTDTQVSLADALQLAVLIHAFARSQRKERRRRI